MAKGKKPARTSFQTMVAHGLALKWQRQAKPANALADAFVSILARDRRVKDPVAAAHQMLSRSDRRALGARGSGLGLGEMAPRIQTRNAR